MPKIENPNLAQWTTLSDYTPTYGDYVVWSGWMTSWHGFVVAYDVKDSTVSIIFEGLPFLLLTASSDSYEKLTRKINLDKIKNATRGTWSIQRHDYTRNTNVWYI